MARYYTIADLEDIYLEDSFVLAVKASPGSVEFDMDVVLRESHPDYIPPKADEQYCYRRASLRFVGITGISLRMESIQKSRDANGELDYGGIDSFETDDSGFLVRGDFGSVTIQGGTFSLDFCRADKDSSV